MIDWIAQAKARFAKMSPDRADKTDETPVSSVLSVQSSRDNNGFAADFVGFVSAFPCVERNGASPNPAAMPAISAASPTEAGSDMLAEEAPDQIDVAASVAATKAAVYVQAPLPTLLAQFHFESLEADMQAHAAAGHDPDELRRVNNLTYYLITVKGQSFGTAMAEAAAWVIDHPPHPKEQELVDVLTLYRGGTS